MSFYDKFLNKPKSKPKKQYRPKTKPKPKSPEVVSAIEEYSLPHEEFIEKRKEGALELEIYNLKNQIKALNRQIEDQADQDETRPILELDEIDLEILKLIAKKYKKSGTNIVRHNMKNPFLVELSKLAYMVQNKDIFKEMHKKGILGKTKYAGQWELL